MIIYEVNATYHSDSGPMDGSKQFICDGERTDEQAKDMMKAHYVEHCWFGRLEVTGVQKITNFEWNEQGKTPLCGDNEDGSHWTWFGNHEPGCIHA